LVKRLILDTPKPEPQYGGELKDRSVLFAPSWTGVPYWDVVDPIDAFKEFFV
jgi:hypothetical protein